MAWDPRTLELRSCCEVIVGSVIRFNQIDGESAFSHISVGFVSRTDLWLRSRTSWWSESIQGLRQLRRLRPCGGARGEMEVTMRLLFWAGGAGLGLQWYWFGGPRPVVWFWARFGSLFVYVFWLVFV